MESKKISSQIVPVDTDNYKQANAIGRSSKTVREFLEKNYNEDMEEKDTVKLTIKSLLEVVQTGAKNIEIVVMTTEGEVKVK
jgi:20S proteasome subunit alpha 4